MMKIVLPILSLLLSSIPATATSKLPPGATLPYMPQVPAPSPPHKGDPILLINVQPIFTVPGELKNGTKPPMPIVRQPVEPCPNKGCPTIKGPSDGYR
jgi:hypothetical protein